MLNKVEKVEKDENVENVKIEPDYDDYAGWMDGGGMDQKSNTNRGKQTSREGTQT